jgi:hypothetical protein
MRWLPILLLLGCGGADDDDTTPMDIPAPEQCSNQAFDTVTFDFNIHFAGLDYPQDVLLDLLDDAGVTVFPFPFEGRVTELGPAADSPGRMAFTVTAEAAPGDPPLDDPDSVRVLYSLPGEEQLPIELEQSAIVEVLLDSSRGPLLRAFRIHEGMDAGAGLLFLAEPSDVGLAYVPGVDHPLFTDVVERDRACPNLRSSPCASNYNLSMAFTVHDEEDGTPGERMELWPGEGGDFDLATLPFRVVNVWSYAWREIDPDCATGYDYDSHRFAYYVTRR